MNRLLATAIGWYAWLKNPQPHDERGLSQSTENALLLGGAATIALAIVAAIKFYVESRLPK
ncbi:MAG: hypothetical protein Q3997_04755 [Propionibacteriaceae bacterium]|nr:hypothetical protein [Propionibacteriaceae bacterium]